ncbi:Uma2 family endonuclease, partial [Dolichospermum sp. ST_sed2]|nr:Uma2 family endonuclease [Dolichospermum sp. ST_sed2]MDD1468900.1 Uma2 family endonuclease [Dolichospermum sp. ST_sed5]
EYQPLEANEKGHLWSQQLGLYLGIYEGLLRYFTPEGKLVPTPEESAEFEAERATIEAERSERLAAKLRELNIDPDTL